MFGLRKDTPKLDKDLESLLKCLPQQDTTPQGRIEAQKGIIKVCDKDIRELGERLDKGEINKARYNEDCVFYQDVKIRALQELLKLTSSVEVI